MRAAPAAESVTTTSTTAACQEVEPGENGTSALDIDRSSYAMLRHGGAVTVSAGGLSRSFTLATDREWFIDAARHSAGAVSAATIVEVLSGAYITVSLADGRELTRQVPDGETELGTMFDAMGAAAPAGGAGQ